MLRDMWIYAIAANCSPIGMDQPTAMAYNHMSCGTNGDGRRWLELHFEDAHYTRKIHPTRK
jgi:hypothetical protein